MALDHKHLLVTAHINNPIDDEDFIKNWFVDLVKKVDMNIFFGPYVKYCGTEGNEGTTGIVCIETSHASIHIWSQCEKPHLKFDLYSCKCFDIATVLDHLNAFGLIDYEYMLLDRNNGIEILHK